MLSSNESTTGVSGVNDETLRVTSPRIRRENSSFSGTSGSDMHPEEPEASPSHPLIQELEGDPSSQSWWATEDITRPYLRRLLRRRSNGKTNFKGDPPPIVQDQVQPIEQDVLVHELSPTDSLASVAIKYGVPIAELRRVNKLWSSDTIHLRKTIFIPLRSSRITKPDNLGEGVSTTTQYSNVTIRRIPTSELSYFPRRSSSFTVQHEDPLRVEGVPTPMVPGPPSFPLSRLLRSLPSKESILSRLSFDSSRTSEISDDGGHELALVTPPAGQGTKWNGGSLGRACSPSDATRSFRKLTSTQGIPRELTRHRPLMQGIDWSQHPLEPSSPPVHTSQPRPTPIMKLPVGTEATPPLRTDS